MPGLRRPSDDHELIDYEAVLRRRAAQECTGLGRRARSRRSQELKARIDRGDARRSSSTCATRRSIRFAGSPGDAAPAARLPHASGELDRGREMVVHCKSGMRSAKAIALLQHPVSPSCANHKGGILEWIDKVDPTESKYEPEQGNDELAAVYFGFKSSSDLVDTLRVVRARPCSPCFCLLPASVALRTFAVALFAPLGQAALRRPVVDVVLGSICRIGARARALPAPAPRCPGTREMMKSALAISGGMPDVAADGRDRAVDVDRQRAGRPAGRAMHQSRRRGSSGRALLRSRVPAPSGTAAPRADRGCGSGGRTGHRSRPASQRWTIAAAASRYDVPLRTSSSPVSRNCMQLSMSPP